MNNVHVTIDGVEYYFIIDDFGKVIQDGTNAVICEKGGRQCLDNYLINLVNPFDEIIYLIDPNTYSFNVYEDGKVVDAQGNLICEIGGRLCLDQYMQQYLNGIGSY